MRPDEFAKAIRDLAARMDVAVEAGQMAARNSLAGVKVRGHRMGMGQSAVRIQGPAAPQVAVEVQRRMGRAAEKATREALP